MSALTDRLDEIAEILKSKNIPAQRLPVPHAFHSRWIEPAAPMILDIVPAMLKPPRRPVWSCQTTAPINGIGKEFLWRVARFPMRVRDTIRNIEARGGATYIDLGPSGTLAAMLPRIFEPGSPSRAFGILSPFGGWRKKLNAVRDYTS